MLHGRCVEALSVAELMELSIMVNGYRKFSNQEEHNHHEDSAAAEYEMGQAKWNHS